MGLEPTTYLLRNEFRTYVLLAVTSNNGLSKPFLSDELFVVLGSFLLFIVAINNK